MAPTMKHNECTGIKWRHAKEHTMGSNIIYIIGLVVAILAVLAFFGFRYPTSGVRARYSGHRASYNAHSASAGVT